MARHVSWYAAAALTIACVCAASLLFGVRGVTGAEIVAGLRGGVDSIGSAAVAQRVPRTVLALMVGAALGIAGTVMQALTRNPLADPGILGVSGGAALAVVCGIAFFGITAPYATMGLAVAGAAVAAVFVYAVGSSGRSGATPLTLALAGAATATACSALVSAILLPRVDILEAVRFWQIGGVGGASWERNALVAPVLLVGALVCVANARGMNALALGDDVATGLGAHVARTRMIAALGAVILCGVATAVAGPIGFVGLIVPHVCRLLLGTDLRWLIPFSAMTGATLLVAADVIGRLVARPAEMQVGIITALVGAPFFIWIVRRQKVREL